VTELSGARARDADVVRLVVDAEEAQRRRIADALHDDAVQAITAGLMHLEMLAAKEPQLAQHASFQRAADNLRAGLTATRTLLSRLSPPLLAAQGPEPALRDELERIARGGGCGTELRWGLAQRLDPTSEILLFRTAQDALAAFAGAASLTQVTVSVFEADGGVALEITAEGSGLGQAPLDGEGLHPAADRIALAGGSLSLAAAGVGLQALVWVPLHPVAAPGT
jgi:two-component system, NarL family, sensor histidine kinase UhpB